VAGYDTSNSIPVPDGWPAHVKSALLHCIAMAHLAIIHARGWATHTFTGRLRLAVQLEQARSEISQLQEEIRIKDARMESIDPHRRPHYRPTDRLAILELKAARGWSARPRKRQCSRLALVLRHLDGNRNLPIVELKKAA
jgi:hypothetical protein